MKQHARLIIICATIVAVAAILAAQFRYETFNKGGWRTAIYDRWTGAMTLCGTEGCYSDDELRRPTEVASSQSEQSQDVVVTGYSATDVLSVLSVEKKYVDWIREARNSGYTDDEIVDYIRKQATPKYLKDETYYGDVAKAAIEAAENAKSRR